jgi:hypothetical protein
MKKKMTSDTKVVNYAYVDYKADTLEPFYCGKGNGIRINCEERNLRYNNTVRAHGLLREIVFASSIEDLAFEREIELIAEYHTFVDDPLYNKVGCNYTPGGEGHVPSQATRKIYSKRMKRRWEDPKNRATLIASMKGKKRPPRSPNWCKHRSKIMSGTGNPHFGKQMSPVTKAKQRVAHLGKKLPPRSTRTISLVAAKKMKQVKVTCPEGIVNVFKSQKEAVKHVADKLSLSWHTVNSYFVAKHCAFRGFVIEYALVSGTVL